MGVGHITEGRGRINSSCAYSLENIKSTTMYHLYRLNENHKWRVSENPPAEALLHEKSSDTRKAAIVRRAQLNAAIEADRQSKKQAPRGKHDHLPKGREPTGKAKVRVVLTVPPDVVAAIPGNKNVYGNQALKEKLTRDGLLK